MNNSVSDPYGAPLIQRKKSKAPAVIAGVLVLCLIVAGAVWALYFREDDSTTTTASRPSSTASEATTVSSSPALDATESVSAETETVVVTESQDAAESSTPDEQAQAANSAVDAPADPTGGETLCGQDRDVWLVYAGNNKTSCESAILWNQELRNWYRRSIFQQVPGAEFGVESATFTVTPPADRPGEMTMTCEGIAGKYFNCSNDEGYAFRMEGLYQPNR